MNGSRLSLCDLLPLSAINLDLRGVNRDDVLRELAARIPSVARQADAEERLVRALQEREQLHSTDIGDGFALPHARNALVGLVDQPVIGIGRHPTGVSFGALDGRPTRFFFLLVAPTVTQHLAILARISRLLRDPKLRRGLLEAKQPDEVLALLRAAEAEM